MNFGVIVHCRILGRMWSCFASFGVIHTIARELQFLLEVGCKLCPMPWLFLPIVSIVIHISVLFTKYHFQNKQEYRPKPHSNIHAILLSFQGIEILYQFCVWRHRDLVCRRDHGTSKFSKAFRTPFLS